MPQHYSAPEQHVHCLKVGTACTEASGLLLCNLLQLMVTTTTTLQSSKMRAFYLPYASLTKARSFAYVFANSDNNDQAHRRNRLPT